jgi:integrase
MKTDFKVYWSERDQSWVISYKKTNGKWSTKSIPRSDAEGPTARTEADRYAEAWYQNYARNGGRVVGFQAPTAPAKTTHSEYQSWLEEREKNPKLKASTWKQNTSHKAYILKHPMSLKPLLDLTAADAKDFVIYARDRLGLRAAFSVRNVVHSYSAFLGSRIELTANPFHHPAVRAELPAPKPKWGADKPHILPEYVPAFMECGVPAIPGWRWVKNAMALFGGARDGELQGLKWSAVNLTHEIPHYKLTTALAFHTKNGYAQLDEMKTANSVRVVPLHDIPLARLRWWKSEGWRKFIEREPTDDDFVFPNARGQSWRPKAASQLREDLAAARIPTRYGEHPLTEHALRRTFSTLLHIAGVETSTISELLGHADGSTAGEFYIFRYLAPHAEAIRRISVGSEKSRAQTQPKRSEPRRARERKAQAADQSGAAAALQ